MSEHVTVFIENLNRVQVGWTYSAQATDPHIISLAASQLGAASYQLWLVTAKSLSVHWQIFWGIVNARFTRPKELFRVGLMVIFRSSKSHIFHCQFDFQFAFALDSISCKWYTRLSGCNNPLRLSSLLGATYAAWLYYLHFLSRFFLLGATVALIHSAHPSPSPTTHCKPWCRVSMSFVVFSSHNHAS